MHELSLMLEVLALIEKDARERQIAKVDSIELIVGELSNAFPDALEMAFQMLKFQTSELLGEAAQLTIIEEKALAFCEACQLDYHPDQWIAVCPSCNQPSGKLLAGETLKIKSYQGVIS